MNYQKDTFSENETIILGTKIARFLTTGDVIALFGELGSGKTCIIKGICQGLAVKEDVTSPTFTIINEYINKFPIYHFDFYRINSDDEIYGLGYEEYFYGSGICLIEWADRIEKFLPSNRIEIHLKNIFEEGKENIREIKIRILGKQIQQRNWTQLQLN